MATTSNDAVAAASEKPHFTLPLLRLRAVSTLQSVELPSSPLQTCATIPFTWEEKPGVPRACCITLNVMQQQQQQQPIKCLELPPCRVFPRTPSPTSVLDAHRRFSSFRILSGRASPDFDSLDVFLGSGRKKKKGGSFRFSLLSNTSWESDETCTSTPCTDDKLIKKKKKGVMNPQTRPRHLLGNLCKGLKHVIQWKYSRKIHKESVNE